MRRAIAALALSLGLTCLTGCLELSQDHTLNPDGSGKVLCDAIAPGGNPFEQPGAPKPDPKEVVKKAIEERITKAKGVDAWSDVTCELTKEGKVHFRGTAYFSDINKMNLDGKDESPFKWVKDGDAMVLQVDPNQENKEPADPNAAKLTDAQVEEKIKEERLQWQQTKPMMQAFFADLKVRVSFAMPGEVAEANVMKKEGNKVSISLDGKQMLAAMDKLNADDAAMKAKVRGGPEADAAMSEAMFGAKGPIKAKVTGLKPQFDYQAEVAKAKAAEAEMFKKLGVDPKAAPAE